MKFLHGFLRRFLRHFCVIFARALSIRHNLNIRFTIVSSYDKVLFTFLFVTFSTQVVCYKEEFFV